MKKLNTLLFILLFTLIGCGNDDLPKVETLSGFRVLAIVADNPEAAPGATVTLSLLLSDINGAGRTISGTWRACEDPGIALGATPSCENVSGATASSAFSVNFSDSDFGSSYTGLDTALTFNVNIPATILDGANAVELQNGKGYVVVFRFTVEGREVRAFKTIIVSSRTTKNSNPGNPTSILLNGSTLNSLPKEGDSLSIPDLTDEETYQAFFSDGSLNTITESYNLSWYISKAKLSAGKVAEGDSVKLQSSPRDEPFVAVVVVRDERGGIGHRVVNIP